MVARTFSEEAKKLMALDGADVEIFEANASQELFKIKPSLEDQICILNYRYCS